ncbi:MAG: phosphatase PAP2 family protein [Desulfuromonadales bacterium]|nr:phosphatase PAP2 family protein [Desulfuromonadales bacterium]
MARSGTLHQLSAFCTLHITTREVYFMQWLCELRHYPFLNLFFLGATRLGDGPLWYAVGAGFLAFGTPDTRRAVAAAAIAIALSVTLFKAIKKVAGRPRPFEAWLDLPCLLAPPDRFSFPSGHTMTAFAAATVFALLIPGTGIWLLPAGAIIGFSRVYLGCHYPTDVIVGALLGSGIGAAVVWGAGHPLLS